MRLLHVADKSKRMTALENSEIVEVLYHPKKEVVGEILPIAHPVASSIYVHNDCKNIGNACDE